MGDKPVSIWCVSDGRAGIERQTIAVADAMSELKPVDMKVVRLEPRGLQLGLPPTLWPLPRAALPVEQRQHLKAPWPDVWIGNGRRSIPYSLRAKKWSGGQTLVVQLQNPRVNPARFDVVAPPLHDHVRGPNVVSTLGAPVWYTQHQIRHALLATQQEDKDERLPVLVILGGSSKHHTFTLDRAHRIVADLQPLLAQNLRLMMTTSRRTPQPVEAVFRAFASNSGFEFFADETRDGPNPYLAWLAQARIALVSEDSTNMMTDAAFFGLPIYLIRLDGGDAKFTRLHDGLIKHGAARWFEGHLASWTYRPVRDAMVIAEAIVAKLKD
ncbi:mitochondrial fission ELM1 family protein [Candidatus Phycosocius spiralis]|uniref:Nucleoside-diphosphate sugar epimerase n=1 Tax=Candidatus Phycosocius spiralis TaxID=2815099 RepID=A0ABQ4PWF5_9PROT|nr:mitochondrial fission ELM1 family protein [Candidatus Phycosocius spiralis]GIU67395.1 nucleoside-diphosphate sugar epimerase [Candidatus Phycosocius spiralis]